MGFSDLKFGWHNQGYTLRDISIYNEIRLLQNDKEYGWGVREASFVGIFSESDEEQEKESLEFENLENIKYSRPLRRLSAKAYFDEGGYNQMYLGVPGNRQTSDSFEDKIDSFDFEIHEAETDDLKKAVRAGRFSFLEYDAEYGYGGNPFAAFYVPSEVFDGIERLCAQRDIELFVSINKKGWYWLGPIGDTQVYFDKDNSEMAEIVGITVNKKFNVNVKETLADEVEELLGNEEGIEVKGYSQAAIDSNIHIVKKLVELGGQMASVKAASWVAAVGIVFLVLSS